MSNTKIAFKGIKEGVYLEVKGDDPLKVIDEIQKKMKKSLAFYQGTKFLGVYGEDLSRDSILEISLLLKYKYGMDIGLDEIVDQSREELISMLAIDSIDSAKNIENTENLENTDELEHLDENSEKSHENITKFVYGTLRSGQIVEYNGNIVVVGDVNPGGVLKAGKNIVVLGSLKGVAQAGLVGGSENIVAAYKLLPTQLRIGDKIVRSPDNDIVNVKLPEVAKLVDGEIIIEPYLPNK